MSDARAQALEFKSKGNQAFAAQNWDEAIDWYSKAIEKDPTDHVFFSNRSACYLGRKDAGKALSDAEECVRLKPDWAKGYVRKGAALHGLGRLQEASQAYEEGLSLEPSNAALQEGLQSVKAAAQQQQQRTGNPLQLLTQLFGPQALAAMMSNPATRDALQDPDLMAKLAAAQSNPQMLMQLLQDPRMQVLMQAMTGAAGAGEEGGMDMEGEGADYGASAAGEAEAEAEAEPEPEPEPETEEQKAAREAHEHAEALKSQGNDLYKSKQFDQAIELYNQALAAEPTNATYLNNRAAAEFEKGDVDACVATCREALELARSNHASFELVAKIYARLGNALTKAGDLDGAIRAYKDSVLENPSKVVSRKLAQVEALKQRRAEEAYLDPAKAAEAKEKGNQAFKDGKFPEAVDLYTDAIRRDPGVAAYYSNRAAAFCKLMDFGKALEDTNKALELDPTYVKAWSRKGSIHFFLKQFHKAMDAYREGLKLSPDDEACKDGLERTVMRINQESSSQEADPERAARAMEDPEIQAILRDPSVSQVLNDLKENPASAQAALRDPTIMKKLERLVAAGILRLG